MEAVSTIVIPHSMPIIVGIVSAHVVAVASATTTPVETPVVGIRMIEGRIPTTIPSGIVAVVPTIPPVAPVKTEGGGDIPPGIPVAVIPEVWIPVGYVVPGVPHPPGEAWIVETTNTVAVIILLYHIDGIGDSLGLSRKHQAVALQCYFGSSVERRRPTVVGVNVPIVIGFGGPNVVRSRFVSLLAAVLTAVIDVVLSLGRDCCGKCDYHCQRSQNQTFHHCYLGFNFQCLDGES